MVFRSELALILLLTIIGGLITSHALSIGLASSNVVKGSMMHSVVGLKKSPSLLPLIETSFIYTKYVKAHRAPNVSPMLCSANMYFSYNVLNTSPNLYLPAMSSNLYLYLSTLRLAPRVTQRIASTMFQTELVLQRINASVPMTTSSMFSSYTILRPINLLVVEKLWIEPKRAIINKTLFSGVHYWALALIRDYVVSTQKLKMIKLTLAIENASVGLVVCNESSCRTTGVFVNATINALSSRAIINSSFVIPWSYSGEALLCVKAIDELNLSAYKCIEFKVINSTSLEARLNKGSYLPSEIARLEVKAFYNGSNIPVANDTIYAIVYMGSKAVEKVTLGKTNSEGVLNVSFRVPSEGGSYTLMILDDHGGRASIEFRVVVPKAEISYVRFVGKGVHGYRITAGSRVKLEVGISFSDVRVLKWVRVVMMSSPLLNATYYIATSKLVQQPTPVKVLSASFSATGSNSGVITFTLSIPPSVSGSHTLTVYLATVNGVKSVSKQVSIVPATLATTTTNAFAKPRAYGGAKVLGGVASTMILEIALVAIIVAASATFIAMYVVEKARKRHG